MRKSSLILLALIVLVGTMGCSGLNRTQNGALIGAGAGAALGGAIGRDVEGALIGAGLGGVTGALIGDAMEDGRLFKSNNQYTPPSVYGKPYGTAEISRRPVYSPYRPGYRR